MRATIYARVSTLDQEPENQLAELRRYIVARSWPPAVEYVDKGVSGSTDRRPALDRLIRDAKRRGFDVLICWRLDRLGRNLRHLVTLLDELHVVGVSFVSLGEGIDCTTPAGRLQLLCARAQDVADARWALGWRGGARASGHIRGHREASQARSVWSSRQLGVLRDICEALDGGSQRRSAASLARTVISA